MKKASIGLYVQMGTGVQTISTLKSFLDIGVKLGYEKLYLGIGESFKVKNQPYYSYMRGRYEMAELKELNEYAKANGVEIIPAIQTLGHCHTIPCYSHYGPIIDHHDVLLIDEEKTYEFLEDIISTISDIFGKCRLMIGGDEAHLLGAGKYYDKHGPYDRTEIFVRHLKRVIGIATKYDIACEMWSDMLFKLETMNNYSEDHGFVASNSLLNVLPKNLTISHWTYGINDEDNLRRILREHKRLTPNVMLAGGFNKWHGHSPNNTISIKANKILLSAANKEEIEEVIFTMWEDNGGEASIFSILPAMFEAAIENGNISREEAEKLFVETTGMTKDEYMIADYLDYPYFQEIKEIANCSFYYLYADPLLAIFHSMVTENIDKAFADYAAKVAKVKKGRFAYIFDVYEKLALVLEKKAKMGVNIKNAYKANDKETLRKIATEDIPEVVKRLDVFFKAFDIRWKKENMPGGFEIHCARIGAARYRMLYVAEVLLDYCDGKLEVIRDLEDETLPFTYVEGAKEDTYALMCWNNIFTAGINW